MTFKQRFIRFLILSAVGLTLGAAIAAFSVLTEKQHTMETSPLIATTIGGPFKLVDQDGKTRTEKDFATKYKVIYFGFASCPAICPTELQKIAEAYKALTPDQQKQVQPLFITIDPERDTPKVLKSYVGLFLPQMMGLTGSAAQIDAVKNTYKIYATKVPQGKDPSDYTMDHSSFIYVTDQTDHVIAMFKTEDNAAKVASTLQTILTK
jgi:protein SCO1/2